jgi:DNA helicase-2/ATP-dependent DNA helicase PcrA
MTESTEVIRLFGGPGSGKTTALLDRVEELIDSNDDLEVRDILVVSYTRAAAAEIRERLAGLYDPERERRNGERERTDEGDECRSSPIP